MPTIIALSAGGFPSTVVAEVAFTSTSFKVRNKDALRTAAEFYDGQFRWADSFPASEDKMYVVAQLPSAADRNAFRITIVRKDERQDLAVMNVTWDKRWDHHGVAFSPREIAAKGGGPGEYTAKFYSGPTPVLTCDFALE